MFKTIVWATDGSDAADAALPYVRGLAEGEGHKLVVVHSKELLRGRAGGYQECQGGHQREAGSEGMRQHARSPEDVSGGRPTRAGSNRIHDRAR